MKRVYVPGQDHQLECSVHRVSVDAIARRPHKWLRLDTPFNCNGSKEIQHNGSTQEGPSSNAQSVKNRFPPDASSTLSDRTTTPQASSGILIFSQIPPLSSKPKISFPILSPILERKQRIFLFASPFLSFLSLLSPSLVVTVLVLFTQPPFAQLVSARLRCLVLLCFDAFVRVLRPLSCPTSLRDLSQSAAKVAVCCNSLLASSATSF